MATHNSQISLADRVILVTGASRGIGASIAETCASLGARVVLSSRKEAALHEIAHRIKEAGGTALAKVAHMGDTAAIDELFKAANQKFGPVDGLVNNAATNPYFGPMLGIKSAAWAKTFEVNVAGYFAAIKKFVSQLDYSSVHRPSVVNIASVAGMRAAPFQGVYGMTKAAVISMTQTLAHELGTLGVRVNAICPGLIETKFSASIVGNDSLREMVTRRTALHRHGQPAEIAGAATYLLSDAASYVTGQSLVIDGGLTSS